LFNQSRTANRRSTAPNCRSGAADDLREASLAEQSSLMTGPLGHLLRGAFFAVLALCVQSCASDEEVLQAPTQTTEVAAPLGNFVCFRIAASSPEDLSAFEDLLEGSGVADDTNMRGGLKADAAVSVRLESGVNAAYWIESLPTIVSSDSMIRSIEPSGDDCAIVDA
jgi:hypothetical protein